MNFNNQFKKNTKIISTCGPTFETEQQMRDMFKNGVNVIRLNMSHGSFEEHIVRIINARKIAKEMGIHISILLDTKGPEIRIKDFKEGKIKVSFGQKLNIHCGENILGDEHNFSISYKDLYKIVKPKQSILCDDGKLELQVVSIDTNKKIIKTISKNKHKLSNNKAINVPGANLTLPFISKRDKESIEWGLDHGIDYIAASFVSDGNDIKKIRKILKDKGREDVQIMPKIESLQSVNNLNSILKESDAVMLARGDLGVEIPYEQVPFYEKLIINKCRAFGLPIVVATQMLDSMQDNPRPTRAEVTDIYYAVISGADATMLSGESASGNFPTEAVEVMAKVNREGEKNFDYQLAYESAYAYVPSENAETAYKVAKLSLEENAPYILAFSQKGRLIKALSRFRPKSMIVGMTTTKSILTKFGAWYGVYMKEVKSLDDFKSNPKIIKYCKEMNISGKVIVADKNDYRIINI